MDISVVIPAYNEEQRLPPFIARTVSHLERRGGEYEIIVVDDGSTDNTADCVSALGAAACRVSLVRFGRNRGKGWAVREGMLKARGRLRLFSDADGATPIEFLDRLVEAVDGGADIAIGTRSRPAADTAVTDRFHRKVMGVTFNGLVRLIAVPGITDTQCGFKLFTARAADTIFPLQTIGDFGFDVEILAIARLRNFTIREVPVSWSSVGDSKIRLCRDSLRMFADVVKVRLNLARGVYSGAGDSR